MSLEKFLQTIGHDIASEEQKIFGDVVNTLEKTVLPAVIDVTNALKTITEEDSTDIIGHLGGSAGAAIEDEIRAALPIIVPKLQMAQVLLAASPNTDPATILAQIVKVVGTAPAETKTAFWIEFSGQLANALQTKLTVAGAIQVVQWFYKNYPVAAAALPAPAPAAS
jgi:hypothetical protein